MPKNLIQHIEWTTRDPARLRTFFGRIFDWQFRDLPDYTMIDGVGGIFDAPDPRMPLGVTPYVTVADIEETERRVRDAGGQIHKSKQEVPQRGWFTIFSDPDGNMIALWQPMQKPRAARTRPSTRTRAARKKAARRTGGSRKRRR